jgi:Tetracyclin repressor-like, C-terminal domain
MDATLADPDWARLVIWEALGDDRGDADERDELQRARVRDSLQRIRHQQEAGAVTVAVEAELVLLLAFALAFAPIALPRVVDAIFGAGLSSQEYRDRALGGLFALLEPDHTPRASVPDR